MEIKAEVKSIENLKDFFFIVPDYQREYVWKADEHVTRFLQDISNEFKPNVPKQSNYFIGSTIIVKRTDGKYDVVDGQQRLTTIVISLCAIRSSLQKLNIEANPQKIIKEELLKIVKELLYKFDISSLKYTTRLFLQYEESKNYLEALITETEFEDSITTPSIKKMQDAFTTVLGFLEDFEKDSITTLIGFVSYFLTNVEMVIIMPDNIGSALKIFETINERGVGLNAMDLLKNLLFSNANSTDFETIKKTWKEILETIRACGKEEKPLRFLRYFLMARYHDGILREDDIYKWMISDEGKSKVNYSSKPVVFSEELKAAAKKYAAFIKATHATDADDLYPPITGIGYLSKKTSRQHLVLLMALKEKIDNAIINRLASNIESLVFYYSVNRTLTKSYEEKFANWAIKLRAVNTSEQLNVFLEEDLKKELTEQQAKFNAQFATKSQSDLNPQYRIKYILGKLEEYIRNKVNFPSANYAFYQSLQLEHILPQAGINIPSEQYPQVFDYANTVYRFGNLTLLEAPINQSLNFYNDLSSDEWFNGKKNAYLNSNVIITRTFSDVKIGEQTQFNGFASARLKPFNEWNMTTIAERQEVIRKLALEVWKMEV